MTSFMLLLHVPTERPSAATTDGEAAISITREYMDWADRLRAAGQHKGGSKLTNDAGKILRGPIGHPSVTDGPYAEGREIVGGFFIIAARDYTEACSIAQTCPHLKYGSYIEVRQVQEL